MIYLLLTILFNVILAVIFRYFKEYGIRNVPAIVINYVVCSGIAAIASGITPWSALSTKPDWLPYGIGLGFVFIVGFVVIAYTVQYYGMGFTAVFQKISLIITVLFSVLYFGEVLTLQRMIGIPLAISAILLINWKNRSRKKTNLTFWILFLPIITFILNGVGDTLFYFIERINLIQAGNYHFISFMSMIAGLAGILIAVYQVLVLKKKITRRELIGGIILGIPNFFSVHFFISALGAGFDGSIVVPLNNVGIILLSAIVGFFLFGERFSKLNLAGIGTAVAAIILLTAG